MKQRESIAHHLNTVLDENGQLPCEAAHSVARQLGIGPGIVGEVADVTEVRISRCQLGLFGHAPKKGMDGFKTVIKLANVPADIADELSRAAPSGEISCAELWRMAREKALDRSEMGNIAETLGLRVRPCQLGCF